jgi:hypothetical protein
MSRDRNDVPVSGTITTIGRLPTTALAASGISYRRAPGQITEAI